MQKSFLKFFDFTKIFTFIKVHNIPILSTISVWSALSEFSWLWLAAGNIYFQCDGVREANAG